MSQKIKSVREAYTLTPETFAVTTNQEKIKERPSESIKEIKIEPAPVANVFKTAYVGYSYTGSLVFYLFVDAATVQYFNN